MQKIPKFLQDMLLKQYGQELTKNIKEGYIKQRPVTLRVNTIKTNKEKIKRELTNSNIIYKEVNWNENALIIDGNVREEQIKRLKIYEDGEIYLQSLSSMLPPIILEPRKEENILDMTAAPGGKTTQIAAITNNEAFITACEKNKIRAERLKYNLEKQGVKCVNIMIEDARKLDDFFSFDKILLDAPCSGSGTENIYSKNFSRELIENTKKIQEELIQKALKILKPGREMIYSTCSILKQENENIIKKVLKETRVKISPIQIQTKLNIPLLPTEIPGTICVCPDELYEGFFIAKLKIF